MLIEEIKKTNVEYHTYSLPNEINVKLVLKGIPSNVTETEILNDLRSKNYEVIAVKQFTRTEEINDTKNEKKLPIYLLEFKPNN